MASGVHGPVTRLLRVAAIAAAAGACRPEPGPPAGRGGPPNVLLVVLDDVGVEPFAAFHPPWPGQARTPVLDRLAASGVRFRNAYANAECSPTRAALLTGRYARRTGLGRAIAVGDEVWLDEDEVGLPEVLTDHVARLAGKWHLGGGPGLLTHPAAFGFERFAGSPENLLEGHGVVADPDYHRWAKDTDGVLAPREAYATRDTTDDALDAVAEMPEPWLAWVAYNAAHGPYHAPPADLLSAPVPPDADGAVLQRAMVEAVDAELGRLLAGVAPEVLARTLVVVVGDNGSPGGLLPPGSDRSRGKPTVYQAGIHVPLLVAGPGVRRGASDALVHAVDVFATLVDLVGADLPPDVDGVSFRAALADPDAPGPRTHVWSERFEPNGDGPERASARSIRDADHALVRTVGPDGERVELFSLRSGGPDEGPDLLADGVSAEEATARDALLAALDAELAALR